MSLSVDEARVRVILLDIEGTTTSVDFVYQALFPYARQHVEEFLGSHRGDASVNENIEQLRAGQASDAQQGLAPPVWQEDSVERRFESAVRYVEWLMDRDRKSTALKMLQGRIWEAGYRARQLRGEVYADVPPAFSRWRRQRREICIFSSGSALAQKLLFQTTPAGDLTRFITAYFDTTIGTKREAESYHRIAAARGRPPREILFISDAVEELDAARQAGMQTILCVRPGRARLKREDHATVETFDPVLISDGSDAS